MIISHKNKFIFIKTEKTAGTSIEIALSKYCGPDDVITPIIPEDELIRKKLNYRGPQNYKIPLTKYSMSDFVQAIQDRERLEFYNHASASYIMKYVDQKIWNSYFKFCFERNPWDKVVSYYYFITTRQGKSQLSITDFVHSISIEKIKGFKLYTRSSDIVVDKVFKYEYLDESLKEIKERIGLQGVPNLPNAKGGYRKDKRSYKDILSEKDKERIAKVFAKEISYFDYQW
ncbi:sulfotransferase family 2 domain-containing protein [Crocosphaera sp. Alani8]|uniref:sulfotransferase family 2 domain-containing protein n=1 Tax=Crocosphaera sp. Alani8 TaxID=3038952 RepID=UPI00313DD63E